MKLELFPEAPDDRLPDFMIAGAPKSGTTTLNHLLSNHPDVFLNDDEKFFFNLDNFVQHPAFYPLNRDGWTYHDIEERMEKYYQWYVEIFEEAPEGTLIGEDSPAYLFASRVAPRLRRVIPDIKLLFILRDPVDRTYSKYWHEFRNGRAIYTFEKTLLYKPYRVLFRSQYEKHLRRYFEIFPEDQIKVIVFERFIAEMQEVFDEVCEYLGLDTSLRVDNFETHQHQAKTPRSIRLQLYLNWIFRDIDTHRYSDQLPDMPSPPWRPVSKAIFRFLCSLNLTRSGRPPDMPERTRRFLEKILVRENHGLSDLLNRDLSKYWPYFG